jgi:hypothetical protein
VTWYARGPSPRASCLFLSIHCNCFKELAGMTELEPATLCVTGVLTN